MDNQTNGQLNKAILLILALVLITSYGSNGQAKQELVRNNLSLVSITPMDTKSNTAFDLHFETEKTNVKGRAKTYYMEGYDSLSLDSFEVIETDTASLLKISGFLINKESQNRLKWTSAVDYTISSKNLQDIAFDKYIQFAAYYKLAHANEGLKFFKGFDIRIIQVGGMYKLVAPYSREKFEKAKEKYPEYDIWTVNYKGLQIAQVQ